MKKLTVNAMIAAAVVIFSSMGFGAGAAFAQTNQIELCPDGQTYEFEYVCSRETLQCVLVWQGCR